MSRIAANLKQVKGRIAAAASRAGRNADDITLVAVSKTHPLETVIEAYQAGAHHFGENRVAESNPKVAGLAKWRQPGQKTDEAQWHFIGHIQTRQAGQVIKGQYALLHSIDSLKLAQRIQRLAERDNLQPANVLLQCNVSGESTKAGFTLNTWQSDSHQFTNFVNTVSKIVSLDKLNIQGLMTMAPWGYEPETARPTFKGLAALQKQLQTELPAQNWHHLSMGMTDDFEVAIEEGATIVRVGRAIFGTRHYT